MGIDIKRIYEPYQKADGLRIFVDRLWARGLTKEEAHIDVWLKEVAPSNELRTWFNHDPAKWTAFKKRYKTELKDSEALEQLQKYAASQHVTLLFGAKDTIHNQAAALKEFLQ